ncbi:RNA-binding RNA processing protein rpp1 [Exophiala sideris]|uniref:RNA-binding RNA processing protein rpp1 n=1 Tax=Exophiala sideris TaxID=1016849 RepID=A0ABR0J8G2_9EURO|nr:RNA-binding RNA processing protein rpp1 [Exophiala sideris]KAK5059004.1 RNA-binding RNA processing protein rpp1 [Exophiala sideris]KAK5182836.1 RNA-binding RNA processing protein rpp1 [Eurotiomycetes sp. CCFEE 6388]
MPFHDLNVPYTSNHTDLSHTLAFHAELGYSVIAVSLLATGKLPSTPTPIPLSSLTVPKNITTLTRLTITISDATQNHRLSSFAPHYNLLALRPTTEKALALCCQSLDCDLISLDFSQRLPCILKFKTVASALQRGVRFEICYAPGIQHDANARRNLISGAAQLIRATRGRGVILSSEAKNALGVRGPHDVINLAQVWGLGQERGKEALCEEAGKVVRLAGIKRTSFRGVVDVIDGGSPPIVQGPTVPAQQQSQAAAAAAGANKQKAVVLPTNGTKRKAASMTSASTPGAPAAESEPVEEKPLSKREMKRRAKKARMEGKSGPDDTAESAQEAAFPIQHETLSKENNVLSEKS